MPKTGRSRCRSALSAVAMVPREHSAPLPDTEAAPQPQRSASGRARPSMLADRLPIAVLAFLVGVAACYVVLKFPTDADIVPYVRATVPSSSAASTRP